MKIPIRIIIIIGLIFGLGLFIYSLTINYYFDPKAADKLIINSYDIPHSDYYKKESELRTNKATLMDLGSGISIASIVIIVFFVLKKVKTLSDLTKIQSINKIGILISSNIVWLLLIPGTHWYYFFRGGRGDYPPFADSIGIPIFTQTTLILYLLVPLNLFIGITLIKSNIPTRIFIKADNYNIRIILWEIFFDFWLLISLFCFVILVVDGDHISIPINLFLIYILLTLRAGQIGKLNKEK